MEHGGSHLGSSARSGFTDAEEEEQTLVTFSKEIRKKTILFLAAQKASELIVVAGPQMLGLLREHVIGQLPPGVHITEVRKDLTGHSTLDIHDALLREVLRPGLRMPLEQTTFPAQVTWTSCSEVQGSWARCARVEATQRGHALKVSPVFKTSSSGSLEPSAEVSSG